MKNICTQRGVLHSDGTLDSERPAQSLLTLSQNKVKKVWTGVVVRGETRRVTVRDFAQEYCRILLLGGRKKKEQGVKTYQSIRVHFKCRYRISACIPGGQKTEMES